MTESRAPTRYSGPTALVELLDRVIGEGVVLSGDVIIALAGIDLVRIDLRLLLASAARVRDPRARCS